MNLYLLLLVMVIVLVLRVMLVEVLYSYMWDNGETGIIATSLTSGYRYHSCDDWGCEVIDSIFVPEILVESDLVVDTTVSCYGLVMVLRVFLLLVEHLLFIHILGTGQQTVE